MKVVYCFITKNRRGCDSRQVCFQTGRTTCIHSHTRVDIQGALHTGEISGVFLVNLKIGLLHYEKPYTCINQMQHLHACSSLMFWPSMGWISIPESTHYFNQFVYAGCAAKSVKPIPRPSRAARLQRAHRELIPVLLLDLIEHDFQSISVEILFFKVNPVFRFRNQSLSIQCEDVLFKSKSEFDKLSTASPCALQNVATCVSVQAVVLYLQYLWLWVVVVIFLK